MISFKVLPDDGESYVLAATSRDVLMWERTGKGRSAAKLSDNPTYQDFYVIAHIAARRQGMWTGNLEAFEQNHDLEEMGETGEDEGEADPTRPAR